MTESDWLKMKDPDAMLAAVADRLSPRKWTLLTCSVVRRVWELLPNGPLRQAVLWAEDHAGVEWQPEDVSQWLAELEKGTPLAMEAAREAERGAVHTADPDADEREYHETDARRTHPAVPLFRAASRAAQQAIQAAGEAVEEAGHAVRSLFLGSGESRLAAVRLHCVQALTAHGRSGIEATLALELKARGDDMADGNKKKKVHLRQTTAIETAHRLAEDAGNRAGELQTQKERGDEKALARFLQEQLGNPFREVRFENSWRTETVTGIARAIDEDRATDRYLFLADALLDADCDEEAVLRHCRGTEKHTPEPPIHARGCWVIDRILHKDDEVFAAPPLTETQPPPLSQRLELAIPGLFDINLDDLDDDDFPEMNEDE